MSDLNQFSCTGRLGADPESKRTQDGKLIVNLRVAVSETWRDRSGERKEKTEWVSCTIFSEGLAKVAEQYLSKGSKVFLQGQIKTRSWDDQSGNKRYATELVLSSFDAKLIMLDGPSGERKPETEKRDSYGNQPANFSNDLDDDLPF